MTDALPPIPFRSSRTGKPLPAPAYLHECLRYADGMLFWRERPRSHFDTARGHAISRSMAAGERAGGLMSNGYRLIYLDGQKYLEQRLIYHMLVAPLIGEQSVDHIDYDRSNNKIENLRACTNAQNAMNQPGRRNKYGTPKGVHWSVRERRFKVKLRASGRAHHIGTFETLEAASAAAEAARIRLHGEFANHRSAR